MDAAQDVAPVLIDGKWRAADAEGTFHAENPAKGEPLPPAFPISRWSDCDAALEGASKAAAELRNTEPAKIAEFLDAYASNIEAAAESIVAAAAEETALPVTPRLKDVELPRTTNQLRQAAAAAREESWRHATLDLEKNIRSCFSPIGPVVIFGPNNFPFAFNGVSGGDFAAAIAAGNPVIAKAHPLHPNTTRLLAEQALKAIEATGLPPATVQLIYNVSNENGLKLVTGGDNAPGDGYRYANTLLRASAAQFLAAPHDLQREIFGNATLAVTVNTEQELESILRLLEGNLTGTIYSAKSGADDETYNTIAPLLREKVGRLLNDKMPTGVAVSPAMNHGGPYPATTHPGTTSVGIPTSITRFAKLDCYDAVRPERLPAILKDKIANPNTWCFIHGDWVKG